MANRVKATTLKETVTYYPYVPQRASVCGNSYHTEYPPSIGLYQGTTLKHLKQGLQLFHPRAQGGVHKTQETYIPLF